MGGRGLEMLLLCARRGSGEGEIKLLYLLILTILLLLGTSDIAAAANYDQTTSGNNRLTGSSDRDYYDWGYKQVQISGRRENYYESDCGWWYVSAESTINVSIADAAGDYLVTNEAATTTKGQTGELTYLWGADDEPGRWNVTMGSGTDQVKFYVYVRGQLNVTQITTSPVPTTGSPVTINATLKDNAGNLVPGNAVDNEGNSSAPMVTAYVSGPGEYFEATMTDDDNDGVWNGSFTPQKTGDHMIAVKASDGHDKWVDGRGSTKISVSGTFPYTLVSFSIPRFFADSADMPMPPVIFALLIGLSTFRRFRGKKIKHFRDGT